MANAKTKNADTADKAAAGGEDQSMEEILQSIRKIIAEENDEPAGDAAEAEDEGEMPGSDFDVLELTDVIQDDGSVVTVKEDVLNEIDEALKDSEEEETPAPPPAPAPAPVSKQQPAPKPAAAPADEGLVSAVSIAASAEAMRALKSGGNLFNGNFGALQFASGATVEGLVMQLLRPMLKEWLDANLPSIVQQEVQREVQRITATLDQDQ